MLLKCHCKNRGANISPLLKTRKEIMKKIAILLALCSLVVCVAGCCKCENEPIVEENHKLIVPPNFGNMPK